MFGIALALAAACVAGCASPGKAIVQTVRVETPGCARASCLLSNDQGTWRVKNTPGEALVTTSGEPLKVVCKSSDSAENSAGASSTLSGTHGVGAAAGGAAVELALGSVALTSIPALGVGIAVIGAAGVAAGGSAIESSQQTLSYPPVISVAMSCMAEDLGAVAPRTGRFGVGFRGLSLDETRAQGVGERGALLVTDVAAGGIADLAGLRSGDLVVAVNGQAIVDAAQLELGVLALVPGSSLALKVRRLDRMIEMTLVLPGVAQ